MVNGKVAFLCFPLLYMELNTVVYKSLNVKTSVENPVIDGSFSYFLGSCQPGALSNKGFQVIHPVLVASKNHPAGKSYRR